MLVEEPVLVSYGCYRGFILIRRPRKIAAFQYPVSPNVFACQRIVATAEYAPSRHGKFISRWVFWRIVAHGHPPSIANLTKMNSHGVHYDAIRR